MSKKVSRPMGHRAGVMLSGGLRGNEKTGLAELRRQILERLNDEDFDREGEPAIVTSAREDIKSVSLEGLARICDQELAWDSWSFLTVLGVENDGDVRAEPTKRGWRQLTKLNGGKPFRYPLDTWST